MKTSPCSVCQSTLSIGQTTDVYTRPGCDIEITITGIPAEVCSRCGETYIDLDTLEEIEQLVAPLFEYACRPHSLPSPRIAIDFREPQALAA